MGGWILGSLIAHLHSGSPRFDVLNRDICPSDSCSQKLPTTFGNLAGAQSSFAELDSSSKNILVALIPRYPLISRFLKTLGLDISLIVRFFVVPLVIIKCAHCFYKIISRHLFNLFTSSIRVESDDGLFDIVLAFLVRKSVSTGPRSGIATTRPDKSTDLQSEDFPNFSLDSTNFMGSGARKGKA
jgi:hypothetical protein